MEFDVLVLGGGPGGYVSAIRASQLGLKTVIIENEDLGGVCLNWGCIPTKSLLKSAEVFYYLKNANSYGLINHNVGFDFYKIMTRSRNIAKKMKKGVSFLMKKNKIKVISGFGTLLSNNVVCVLDSNNKKSFKITSSNIIIATGAKSKTLNIQDNSKIINYREALSLTKLPKSIIIIGSGAIGVEFAYFYNSIGVKVFIVEYMPRIMPNEDKEISEILEKMFKKSGITIFTSTVIEKVDNCFNYSKVFINENKKGIELLEAELVFSAVGVVPNTNNIGLDELKIKRDIYGFITVDNFYQTNLSGYFAIGDVINSPSLAHVAYAEGILCSEYIKGLKPDIIDYNNVPKCTYCKPEIASVGYTEEEANIKGYKIKVGKFPFIGSGKAIANGSSEGLVKVIFDAKYGEWLGCHMIGDGVTELISEVVVARKLETTGYEIIKSIHPHPTISECIMEAVSNAYNECINF